MRFAVEDLFVIGLGLDLTGATLLVIGLVGRPSATARRIRNEVATYVGSNPYAAVARALGYVDTAYGLICLLTGFVLQAVAYLVLLGGADAARTGGDTAITALALAITSIAVAVVGWRLLRRRFAKQIVIGIAGDGRPPSEWTDESVAYLQRLGVELGFEPRAEEERGTAGKEIGPGPARYAQRVFRVRLPAHLRHE